MANCRMTPERPAPTCKTQKSSADLLERLDYNRRDEFNLCVALARLRFRQFSNSYAVPRLTHRKSPLTASTTNQNKRMMRAKTENTASQIGVESPIHGIASKINTTSAATRRQLTSLVLAGRSGRFQRLPRSSDGAQKPSCLL
jgi:hypothetical protein